MHKATVLRGIFAPLIKAATRPVEVAGAPAASLRRSVRGRVVRPVVEIDKCVTARLKRFGKNGNAPLQKASEVYLQTGERKAVSAYLASEIERFRPRSLAEVFFDRHDDALAPLSRLHGLHTFLPWDPNAKNGRGYLGQGSPNFGPINEVRLERETDRVVSVTKSLGETGYRPERHWNGYLRGYFLLRGDDYRFYLKGGRHRAGAMAALGIAKASVMLSSRVSPCVEPRDVDDWPQVKAGQISRDLALLMFDRFFNLPPES